MTPELPSPTDVFRKMDDQVDKKGFLETAKGKIIIGVVAGVVLVATIIVIVAVKSSGGKDEDKDEVANQQLAQTGHEIPELSDSDLVDLSQDNFDKLVSGEVQIKCAVPAYTDALNKLLKVSELSPDVFKKLVASPPLVDGAGEVQFDATFNEEEKEFVKKIDKDILTALKEGKPNKVKEKTIQKKSEDSSETGPSQGDDGGKGSDTATDAHQVVIAELDAIKVDALIKAVADNKALAVKAKAADAAADAKLGTELADAVKNKGLTADILKKLVAKQPLSDAENATCQQLPDSVKTAFEVVAPGGPPPPPPPPPPPADVKQINLAALKTDPEIDAAFALIKTTEAAKLAVMAKDGEPASEPLKTQLKTAVTSNIVTLDLFRKLLKAPTSLTPVEMDSIVGDELRAAFGLPLKTPPPPPPVTVTVDFTTINSTDQTAIDAEFAKLDSADLTKLVNLKIKANNGAELDDGEKTALISAVKGKKNIFERLLKKNYTGLSPDESAAIYKFSSALQAKFEVLAKAPTGDVVDFAVLVPAATEQQKKEAFNFLNTPDPAKLTVKKADGSVDATLKDELVDAVKTQGLTENIFIKLINKDALTDADYAVTDKLGQNVKMLFNLVSKAERTFDTAYGVFIAAFDDTCTKLEAKTALTTEMVELQTKFDAAVAAAKFINPEEVSDPEKKRFVLNRLGGNYLQSLFFSRFSIRFENAVRSLTDKLDDVKLEWDIMGKCCIDLRDKKYPAAGKLVESQPDVKLRYSVFSSTPVEWKKLYKNNLFSQLIVMTIKDDVKEALLKFIGSQKLLQHYFKATDLPKEEDCIKKAASLQSLLEDYSTRTFLDAQVSSAKYAEITTNFNVLNTNCKDVLAILNADPDIAAKLQLPAVAKAVATTPQEKCNAHADNVEKAIDPFFNGDIDYTALTALHTEAINNCPAGTNRPSVVDQFEKSIRDKFTQKLEVAKKIKLEVKDIEELEKSLTAVRQADPNFHIGRTAKSLIFFVLSLQFKTKVKTNSTDFETIDRIWNSCKICCEKPTDSTFGSGKTLKDYLVEAIRKEIEEEAQANDEKARFLKKELIWKWIEWVKQLDPNESKFDYLPTIGHVSLFYDFKLFVPKDLQNDFITEGTWVDLKNDIDFYKALKEYEKVPSKESFVALFAIQSADNFLIEHEVIGDIKPFLDLAAEKYLIDAYIAKYDVAADRQALANFIVQVHTYVQDFKNYSNFAFATQADADAKHKNLEDTYNVLAPKLAQFGLTKAQVKVLETAPLKK